MRYFESSYGFEPVDEMHCEGCEERTSIEDLSYDGLCDECEESKE